MTKHTPGPWIADLYEDGCFVVRPHGKEGPLIAERGVWFDDESHANARLIAAAPEMHEKIEAALREWDILPHGRAFTIAEITDWLTCYMAPAMEGLRAAIAKAEGKE